MGSGVILRQVMAAAELLQNDWNVQSDIWSCPSFTELARDGMAVTRWNTLHPGETARKSHVETCLDGAKGPAVAATDYMRLYAEQIRPLVHRRYVVLGTDGFGRSDTREKLRHFFEVNPQYVTVAALKALADDGDVPVAMVKEAIAKYALDPDKPAPWPVIEVLVKAGDAVKAEDPLVTLESDKATMDVPSPSAGIVKEVKVKAGDKVSKGSLVLVLEGEAKAQAPEAAPPPPPPPAPSPAPPPAAPPPPAPAPKPAQAAPPARPVDDRNFVAAHASPSVRKFARELGVDLAQVKGTGPNERILQSDVQAFVKEAMRAGPAPAAAGTGAGFDLLPWPKVDFAKFGPIEAVPLSRIRKISGANLARNWVMIPHVTQFDEADITELEALRVTLNKENEKAGVKVTMLAFLIKASVFALRKFPDFNASLDADNLVRKQYFNIGFAADTPNGLVVPVLKNAEGKGVLAIAKEMAELSAKAREGKLAPADMQGGCFSISSLGGIGGTAFTPIINAPEVAILGVSKSATKPMWNGKEFVPRLMLPLSLSYDHRVIDGAAAARFTTYLASLLADLRRVVL
jgi:pyruvate dehydrogenase E2 component (dihydrolipoamide acetyltransferase)